MSINIYQVNRARRIALYNIPQLRTELPLETDIEVLRKAVELVSEFKVPKAGLLLIWARIYQIERLESKQREQLR